MKNFDKKKTIIITFATLAIFTILGYLGMMGARKFTTWKVSKSNFLLSQSQKEANIKERLILAEKANLLNETDETNFELAKTADMAGETNLANQALVKIHNLNLFYKWKGDQEVRDSQKVFEIYDELRSSYPQVASNFLREQSKLIELTRDQYLILSEDYYQGNELVKAEKFALEARELDNYNPQTYQQLVKIEEKLGSKDKLIEYEAFLAKIAW